MSDLKYLLKNKSDNSVFINRGNMSTDLLQQNLTLLADSKYWHAFVIHNVKNPKKNCILKTVLDHVFPLHLIPVHFQNIGTVCMFLARNCADAILKLCKDGLVIPFSDNSTNSYTCEIVLRYATIDTFKHDIKKNVSTVLESLFDKETKILNLENFSNNFELTEYSPLSQPKILYFVLHLAKKLKPIKINLRNNEIRRLFPLDVLSGATTLQELDLRNNMISNIDEMKNLKLLNLTQLWLDGNPLCDEYGELTYINTLKGIFPLLEILDGVTVMKKGDVIFRRNFLCSRDGFDIVNQFIEHFFQIYDYDRTLLEDLYHSNAVFSTTSMFKRGPATSGIAELDAYEVLNRNLLNLSNSNKNKKRLVKGNVEIVKELGGLPKTNHDPYSFCIDLIHYTDTSATISITGIFCEVSEEVTEPEHLLGFNRLFVIGRSGDRYFIYNDLLHVYNALSYQVNEAFANGEGVKHTHVARTPKDKERAIEAIQLVTSINKEWSKRLLADAAYDVDRFFKSFMKLLKLDKVPEEAYRTSKGYDKDAFLKWIVAQMSPIGVQNFKSPLREEILEYLSERSMLLVTSGVPLQPNCAESTPSISNTTSDPEEQEEALWLLKYENLNLNLISKQSSTVYDNVPMEFSDDGETNQTPNICQSGDSVPSSQLYNVDPSSQLYNVGAIRNHQNHYQSSRELRNQYGLNNVEVGQNQILSSSLYVPYQQISLDIQHTPNPNLVTIGTNIQTTLNSKINPSVTFASEFIPPLPEEECAPPLPQVEFVPPLPQEEVVPPLPQEEVVPPLPQEEVVPPLPQEEVVPPLPQEEVVPPLPQEEVVPPLPQEKVIPPLSRGDSIPFLSQDNSIHALLQLNEYTKKMEEISKLESEKKEVEKTKILFSRFKAHSVNNDLALPVSQSLTNQYEIAPSATDDITSGVVACITSNDSHTGPNPASSANIVSEAFNITVGNTDIVKPHSESKKKWHAMSTRNNLIYVSKIQTVATKCNETKMNDEFERKVTQNKNVEVLPITAKTKCLEKDNSWNAVETDSFAPRSPSIILSNDVIIPPSVYVAKNISKKEKKRLNMRPPTITLLQGKWIHVGQNDKMAFRLVYGKWTLMEKNTIGEWQEVHDDFIKESTCWRKHFPSYQNEILNHTLSASCLKSFLKTSFDSIPDPVTYWDFSASVPYDLRPPKMKTLILTGVINRIHVTPESGFGFISVQGKWVLLAKNEYDNHWIVMTEKGKHIAWINGKWTFGEIPTIQPENKILVKRFMPKLGLFSKKWVLLPTPTMSFKFLFGYWVLFRKNDFGRWNVARDDFAEDFVCKKKHFPGDREPIPNPKEGTWKQPSNFHAAKLSCLPSFDKTIFDSIGFPVTSYHFLPTVPEDLRPPKRCLLLNHESSKYVEKDINPDSNYGFISVNGEWKIREKTNHGTWIAVDMKCIDPRESSSTNTLDQEKITNLSKVYPTSITSNKFNDTTASCDEEVRQIPQEDNQNESVSKEKCNILINQELEKSSSQNIRLDYEKEMNIGERFVKSATLTSSMDFKLKNICEDKPQLVNEGKPVENEPHEIESISEDIALGSSAVIDSVIDTDQISHQTNIYTETSAKSQGPRIPQNKPDIHNIKLKSTISLGSASHSHINDVSCVNVDNNVLKSIEEETSTGNTPCQSFNMCKNYEFSSVENEIELDKGNINEPFHMRKQGQVIEPKISDDAKAINRLKRLNAWKKTILVAPSIPKLTLLSDKWIIVDDDPRLKFREFGIGTWQLLKLHSDGQWKILKDDFILAKEKSNNPNNLEEYMSLIGENKFESIPIPVTNYDFPSSVPKSLRPPLVIEYEQKFIEINANSGYACLVHGRNWILLKQDDQGKWLSLDEKYQNYVEEKLKNTPEKYLSNVRPVSKRMNIHSFHSVDYMQKISAAICPFIELMTGDIPGTIIKPVTYWDVDGEEKVRPPKFALTETDGKTQWFGVRPNLGFGFVLEDGVWVLVKQTEYNEWNNLKISSYEGYILGYYLINNRWTILKKYIFGGQWEPLLDYKTTPCNYWDFIGPEEEKPPRNILFSGKKKSKILHKNSDMGFLKKDDMWILMENKNDQWSAVKDVKYECAYKLIDSTWVAHKKHPDGKWVPIPNSSPKILTYWNFMGLPELAPPRRIIFKEKDIKTEKIIDEKSGLGFVLDKGIWVLVKEGDNDELIHVNHWEGESSQIGFEPINGKFKMITKDEFGNWIRSTNISDAYTTLKSSYTPIEFSFGDEFSKPIPVTFYDVPSHIPEHMRPPKYGCLESLKWERIRKNSGYGFILKNGMWRLMKWTFGRGWLFLEDIVDMLILGYKGIDGRWVPMKKENNEWKTLFDPFSTPRVIEQCYGASSEKPPSRVNLDGVNILDINLGTKLGFVKESDVWILMKHQGGNQWKRFEYFNDVKGIYGYKRVQCNFELMKKNENGNWLRVYWDWNSPMWSYNKSVPSKDQSSDTTNASENMSKKRKSLPTLFSQENIADIMSSYEFYLNSFLDNNFEKENMAPLFIETGIGGYLQNLQVSNMKDLSFNRLCDIWLLLVHDDCGWFMPNDCLGYKLINHRWVLMRKDATGSWLPTQEPIYTPKNFWNTVGSMRPPKRISVCIDGVTKWKEVGHDLNLGFIENDEVLILVKRSDGDWEVMTDDLEESSMLAFKIINYRWKRVKKNEFDDWIPCSTDVLLPILIGDIRGPPDATPPQDFHIICEDGYTKKYNSFAFSNIGFKQLDDIWVVMQCHEDHSWSRHAGTYNNKEEYGYKYMNSKYILMKKDKKENSTWLAAEIESRAPSLKMSINEDAGNISLQRTDDKGTDTVDIKTGKVEELIHKKVSMTKHSVRRIFLKISETPIDYDDYLTLPKYQRPPCYITREKDGREECVKILKEKGEAFIKRDDVWVYVKRQYGRWFIVNNFEGYKLMDNRWVLMKQCTNGSWLPTFDPISTPRTFFDTIGISCPQRVVLCKNGNFEWVIISSSTNLGFINEAGAWILMKKESNGEWVTAEDDLENGSRLCFKLIDNKWQRVMKNGVGVWIQSSKQPSLPVQHFDIIGRASKPPFHASIVTKNGETKRMVLNADSPMGYIHEDGVWILMYLENMVWAEYKMFDEKYTYGQKLINGKWILMKKENDKWIPGMKLATKWTFPATKEKSKVENISSIVDLELAEMISSITPKPFSYFNGFSQFERPPESLILVENGICKRVRFRKDIKYGFHKHNGVWVLMKHDVNWKFAQYSADGLLGHKLIDKRFVVMKRKGRGNWFCTFNPYKTPRNFYDTIGRKFQRPPLRIVLKENGVDRWKIVSEENGLGFIEDKNMWILMQKLLNQTWTKYREESPDEEIGYKIVGNTWKKFKKCAAGEWKNCTQVNLPLLYCDIPVDNGMSTPRVLFHSPRKSEISRHTLGDPNCNFGFLLEDGAWILMKCEENGTWTKFDLFPGEKGTFGYTTNSFELVKKDSNDKWKVITKKSGPNGMYLDFNVEESAEPPAKKIRLNQELTKTQNSSTKKVHSNSSEISSLATKSGLAYLKNLLSTQTPLTLKQINEESRENCPPSSILINTNGTLKRISLSTYVTDVAFLRDNSVWIPIRKLKGEWKTFHSEEELLGYKIIDDRWVIMKNIRNNEWEPTFDPVSTPRNYFDTIATLDRKPPIRIVIKENRIDKWKIVAEENGLGFIKQGVVWVVMTKIGESWVELKDCSGEKIIGYEVKNYKWTKVKKGIDGIWRSCSDACLPCLHWDYIRRDETVPPKVLPVKIDSCKIIKHETIRANSNKGFDMENGAWVLKESKSNGTWRRVDICPGFDGIYGFVYKNGWKIVKKGSDGKWIECNEIFFTENESSVKETIDNSLIESNSLESEIEEKIDSAPSVENSGDLDSVAEQESVKSKEGCSSANSYRDVVIYRPVTYDSLHDVPEEKRPPHSVLINIDGTPKRIFSNEKNTKMGFQKQGDIWILLEKHNGTWTAVQNIDGEFFGFKVIDNRWVNMRKNGKSEWLPSFDPVTTPRTFFDTVGPFSTRPPMIIKIQKDGITLSQTASEENGFGFIKQKEMWVLMEKRADQLWTVYKNDSNQETGYQFVNNKWTLFQKKENNVWSLYSPSGQLKESSDMISDKNENIKLIDISEKNSTSENLDVNGLLPPLTSYDSNALPLKKAKATIAKPDHNISKTLEKESHNGACVDEKLPLNAVEIYLAANPDYEISCPELQHLLLEFRPRDKPKKLIRRRFRLPDGKTILLTIPKNSTNLTESDMNSNYQILKEAETFLATHSTCDWASPDLMEILCKFKLLDSKAPSRCDILFPDGVKRPLSLPRKNHQKSKAIQILGAEIEVILRSYKNHVQLTNKRRISKDEDLNISRKKLRRK